MTVTKLRANIKAGKPTVGAWLQLPSPDVAEIIGQGGYDWAAFTSPNGVGFFFDEFFRLFDDVRSLGLLRIACIGESTAAAIAALHLKVECQPKVASAEALADELIATGSLDSARVLVVTGNLNRYTLAK